MDSRFVRCARSPVSPGIRHENSSSNFTALTHRMNYYGNNLKAGYLFQSSLFSDLLKPLDEIDLVS